VDDSIKLGRIAGVGIGMNWSVLVVFWLITWSLAAGRFPVAHPGYADGLYWAAGLLTSLIFFASLLAHEMSHAIVAKREGVEVQGITLWLFGGVAKLKGDAMTPEAELKIAAVGPAVSLALAGAFWLLSSGLEAAGSSDLLAGTMVWLARINAILALFNLVPAFPLDGGRVLRAILWRRRDRTRATRIAARCGRAFGYILIALGLAEFALRAELGGLWFVFLGYFLLNAARGEEAHVLLRSALAGQLVRDVMTPDPVTVPGWISVQDLIDDYIFKHRYTAFPVIAFDGSPQGLTGLKLAKEVPAERRATTRVAQACRPLSEVPVAHPDEALSDLLDRIAQPFSGRTLVLVDGRVVGIISPADVLHALQLAEIKGKEVPEVLPG
jgi:Zn-dependent protease